MAKHKKHPKGNVNTGYGNIGPRGTGGSYVSGKQVGGLPAAGTPGYSTPGDAPAPDPIGAPPPDWQQIAFEAAQGRGVQYADAQAAYERGDATHPGVIQRDYGYLSDGTTIDPNNPYSKAALLQRNFQQGAQGDNTSYAGQGQLYSGAYQNAINNRAFGYLSDSKHNQQGYDDAMHGSYANQLGAYTNAGSAVGPEKIAALLRALGQG